MALGLKSWSLASMLSCVMVVASAADIKLIIDNQSRSNFDYVVMVRSNPHVDAGVLVSDDVLTIAVDATYSAVHLNTQGANSVIAVAAQKGLSKVRNRACWDTNNRYAIETQHIDGRPVWRFVIRNCDGAGA